MSLPALPNDILLLIFPLLSASDFLSLTSTNRHFHSLRNEHTFWRLRAQEDFKIPPQPLFETDGERWLWLYRNLQTQSEVYTWGNDDHGNLGRPEGSEMALEPGYPRPMQNISGPNGVGVIVDVQCGGWSTVLMNSHGKLFAAGIIDGERLYMQSRRGPDANIVPVTMPMRAERRWLLDVSHRVINSFSMGRKRLLALTDQGEVIEWKLNFTVAGEILSVDHLHPQVDYAREPRATMVVAGWSRGSAFYPGHGLFYWSNIGPPTEGAAPRNRILSGEHTFVVPGTSGSPPFDKGTFEERMGGVKKYIVLDHHILILTTLDKIFSWRTAASGSNYGDAINFDDTVPTELTSFYPVDKAKVLDIQGSFQKFGVFGSDGSVFIGKLEEGDLLNTRRYPNMAGEMPTVALPEPEIKPALQNAGVIQLAFGDYHYHALHLHGEVTSYGKDSQRCGSLGLGRGELSTLRGVQPSTQNLDGEIVMHPKSTGRRSVWFEPDKFVFMTVMLDKFVSLLRHDDAFQHAMRTKSGDVRGTYAEWFEQEGRDWEDGPSQTQRDAATRTHKKGHEDDNNDLPPYFPIKIAAAGWSSAAVVLVDKQRAELTRQRYLSTSHQITTETTATKEESATENDRVSWGDWLGNLVRRLNIMNFAHAVGYIDGQRCDEADRYVWSDQEFPRLRLPGGDESLIEGREPTRWKHGEPSWLRAQT